MRRRLRGTCDPKPCVCPVCGYTEIVEPGIPCKSKVCPKCGARLRRV